MRREVRDRFPCRIYWRLIFESDRILGVERARALTAVLLRASARVSPSSGSKTAYRVSQRLRSANPDLVKVPGRWASQQPVVHARRLGMGLQLDLRDNLQAIVFYTGRYEPEFVRHLHAELRAGDVYADVGAHVGVHALQAARRLQRAGGGRVLAFEPAPDSAAKLRQAADCNGLAVDVHEVALSEGPALLPLYSDERYAAEDAGVRSLHGSGSRVATVEAIRFDDWSDRAGLQRLDVGKIDVEGHEAGVLKGMERALRHHRPRALYVDVKENSLGRSQVSDDNLRELIASMGYISTGKAYDHNELFRPSPDSPASRR